MAFASLDLSGFTRMVNDLANFGGPGSTVEAVFQGEVGSLIGNCLANTPQATQQKIRERSEYRFREKYSVRGSGDVKLTRNTGEKGGNPKAVWLRSEGRFHIMVGPGKWAGGKRSAPNGARWPDRIWNEYQALLHQTGEEREALKKAWIERALASQGLARQSWLQIADALGIVVPNIRPELRSVKGSDGRSYVNGTGTYHAARTETTYTLVNTLPAIVTGGIDGEGIAARALAARQKAFDIAVEKGALHDLDFLSRRYPSLAIVR